MHPIAHVYTVMNLPVLSLSSLAIHRHLRCKFEAIISGVVNACSLCSCPHLNDTSKPLIPGLYERLVPDPAQKRKGRDLVTFWSVTLGAHAQRGLGLLKILYNITKIIIIKFTQAHYIFKMQMMHWL